jgi:hypothetical protein
VQRAVEAGGEGEGEMKEEGLFGSTNRVRVNGEMFTVDSTIKRALTFKLRAIEQNL